MLNNDIIKHISAICKNENIQYDELVVALCQPKLYRLLSEIIMVLMRNDVPVEHVEAVYFYHQGTSPLEHHSLLPELAMSLLAVNAMIEFYVQIDNQPTIIPISVEMHLFGIGFLVIPLSIGMQLAAIPFSSHLLFMKLKNFRNILQRI